MKLRVKIKKCFVFCDINIENAIEEFNEYCPRVGFFIRNEGFDTFEKTMPSHKINKAKIDGDDLVLDFDILDNVYGRELEEDINNITVMPSIKTGFNEKGESELKLINQFNFIKRKGNSAEPCYFLYL